MQVKLQNYLVYQTLELKLLNLAKRAGFYGSIGGITDFVVSNPEENRTVAQTLGYAEDYKGRTN